MYHKTSLLLSILFYFILAVFADDTTTITTSLLSVQNPQSNQLLKPSEQLIIQYTIHGTAQNSISLLQQNYPSSLDLIFRWTQNSNTQQNIQLKAASGLDTDPIIGGRDKVYIHRWKLPNCRFFRRYMPSEWSFSLVFEPHYPEINTAVANSNPSLVHALGPRQAALIIPVSVAFNLTAMEDKHNKSC